MSEGNRNRGVRIRAPFEILGLPAFDVAMGPDPAKGEMRGHAQGFVAIGDIATGVVALGGWARGVVAFGGLATGMVAVGGLSIGLLLALGGGAVGAIAFGGGAAGGVAVGGGAAGYYACGGGAAGAHVVSVRRSDPEAVELFGEMPFLGGLCHPVHSRPR